MSFKRQGFSEVLFEEDLTAESLVDWAVRIYTNRKAYIQSMSLSQTRMGESVMVIDEVVKTRSGM